MIIIDIRHPLHEALLDLFLASVSQVEIPHRVALVECWMKPFMIFVQDAHFALSYRFSDNGSRLYSSDERTAFDDDLLKSVLLDISLEVVACFLDLSHAQRCERRIALDIVLDVLLWGEISPLSVSDENDLTRLY